jgi:hypothetical protein
MKDKEENKSEQQSLESGGQTSNTNWGLLFAIYGNKPFMVREGDPFTNLLPEDDERPDYGR